MKIQIKIKLFADDEIDDICKMKESVSATLRGTNVERPNIGIKRCSKSST